MSAAMVQDMPFVNVQEWELEDLELQGQQQGRSSNALGRSLRLFVRGAVLLSLLALAGHRTVAYGAQQQSGEADDNWEPARRLASPLQCTPVAVGSSAGLPVRGVRYAPHLVGEPYLHPESEPLDWYGKTYGQMHRRDLPLIGGHVGADTLTLKPWPTGAKTGQLIQFFGEMRNAGICKIIPTFHLAKYYADMLHAGDNSPRTDPSSAFAVDFTRFGASVNPAFLESIQAVAWTVDLSVDLKEVLPLVGVDCQSSMVSESDSFQRYMDLLAAMEQWVHPAYGDSVAPDLATIPFLVPLDLSRVSWAEPNFNKRLNTFVRCMSTSIMSGGWWPSHGGAAREVHWMLSFAEPVNQRATYNFRDQLSNISTSIRESNARAVVMVGTQALTKGDANPINSVNMMEDFSVDNSRYQNPIQDYEEVNKKTGTLDGIVYDEWMDDWDRGTRGPFFLAVDTIEKMKDRCQKGSRFSHDIDSCSRIVGNSGLIYPEFFGLAGSSSQLFRHCVHPRFSRNMFNQSDELVDVFGSQCVFMTPSHSWMVTSAVLLAVVAAIQVLRMSIGWCRQEAFQVVAQSEKLHANPARKEDIKVAHLEIRTEDSRFCGGHQLELQTSRVRSNEEAGWWLWMHVSTQTAILERQVGVEARAQLALEGRRSPDAEPDTSDIDGAMRVIHRRVLEGFASWCIYVSGDKMRCCSNGPDPQDLRACANDILNNSGRKVDRLFVECLLLRVMESIGEQMLQCPERLSYLLYHILQEAGDMAEVTPATFSINMDTLHDGLQQMNMHANPYIRKKMPNGKWELGLNFDDINESGIQCRKEVTKTYKEPATIMVIVDFFLCYRVPIMIKMYCMGVAGYIYLGSQLGNDITTTHNGSFFHPKWLRINYIQYTALLDALLWLLLEATLIIYITWQRWPSLGYKSPGIPSMKWYLEHALNLGVTVAGGFWVAMERSFVMKPWECAESDAGDCVDSRTKELFLTLRVVLMYWAARVFLFVFLNTKSAPMFIHGTPDKQARKNSGRGSCSNFALDIRVFLAWFAMLGTCCFVEVVLLLPTMKGLDWSTTCGLNILGDISGLPVTRGICSEVDQLFSFNCTTCLSAVAAGWMLVLLGSLCDVYFVFYLASAVVGGIMGHSRQLNDLKNTSLPIDLREGLGREALLFQRTFGPGWQQIWRTMVKSLSNESFISPKQAASLCEAAGMSLEGEAPLTRRDKKQKPIHLARFPDLAAERLAFFFQSLKWIESQKFGNIAFEPSTDAVTAVNFDVGSIPSLTQIIPAYNEVVIPSVEFLRTGADPENAKNGSPDDQPGLGDLTLPPSGDGVNTNLAFMISQFPDEWVFLAQRLHSQGAIQSTESQELYHDFMRQSLNDACVVEVRMWAAMRCQSVSKTVIGALQYGRALATLPKIKEHYAHFPEKRLCEDHAEVILAHQTYGHSEGNPQNDEAVRLLLESFADDALFLVFDLQKGTAAYLWQMVNDFLSVRGGYAHGAFEQASVKCMWDKARRCVRVLEVLPRKFPLRLGHGEYKTQGKASNQLNGLRFATGHYVQALDCNMGTFIGEAFKVPYVLRMFMPLDQEDRTAPRCRYLGFREYIYTGREGTVGKCHAAAEWTFGTINQRFLSGLGIRMHYGHPDFLDGFWARNRGGMSKSSPVVNLSEDIFAGYNVRMREEASPHIDSLEFEKGREATFNAASNFFSKISGGSISVIRSRDNHLICERIGILHSMSFYFSSVAFYTSNLLVDFTIQLYVILFILFSLAGLGPGKLSALGSTFSTEWIVSMGLVTLVPQLCELVLEYGAVHAVRQTIGGLLSATFFFIFQNKNIAESMKEGAKTGLAKYFFTGRPSANQHQTWKDIYCIYWKSHYKPAFGLMVAYIIYSTIAEQNEGEGKLPMVLVVVSMIAWIITPVLFSPFPRWSLILQDLCEFNGFITSGAGSHDADIAEVVSRGKKGTVRSLYETGLAEELDVWSEQHLLMLGVMLVLKIAVGLLVVALLPAEILDFLPIFVVILSLSWVAVLGYFAAGLNNVFLVLSFLLWAAAAPLAHMIIGDRFASPNAYTRLPEYVISTTVFLYFLGIAKDFVLLTCRILFTLCPCIPPEVATRRLQECIRACFVYFLVQQVHMVEAYVVLFANALTASALAIFDQVFCNAHTWFLLNRELARTTHGDTYMKKGQAPFFELDRLHFGAGSELWGSDSESEVSAGSQRGGDDLNLAGAGDPSWA
mmetsp:Transcript_170644/g.542079  ORF Transcript_170644/g.542079 Transcript_170644/m.542079 type:complete len:2208 (-) Transcript_170644:27-6650(-)|eukprot:CAMPEP_0204250200 /NCGR_PEP_ID=MMETSP0361-20130328/100043_1 /ASSEMBLY_ACC=CAM_ASM_000343 /TAXON_ID=268821 /ORGANISM="Scrippsiella Hangoei, Strain SHTV-5" /LENGTH=2207 /DNA_ID=CAMNT_0051223469 /DNA_START=62 /DNA_END=6685 /DNA_ORIENTATION=-